MQAKVLASMLLLGTVLASPAARADTTTDDVTWVNQCVADNKKEGATEDVVRTYCVCMNNKMATDETQSVSEWKRRIRPSRPNATRKPAGNRRRSAVATTAGAGGRRQRPFTPSCRSSIDVRKS